MIIRPQALLKEYSEFRSVELDYINVLRVLRERQEANEGPDPFWSRFWIAFRQTTTINADLGKILSGVGAVTGNPVVATLSRFLGLQIEVDLTKLDPEEFDTAKEQIGQKSADFTEQQRREHSAIAEEMQDRLLRESAYYCNVAQQQELPPDPHTLLDYPPLPEVPPDSFGVPLLEGLPKQHEIFVVDGLLIVERTNGEDIECYLSDYPPFLVQQGGDAKIKLDLSKESKERLASRSALALGWHPYCRVLGQLSSIEALERSVAPLLISLREPLQVSGTIASELREEWDRWQVEENRFVSSNENPFTEQNMARKIMVGHFEKTIERREIMRKEDDTSDREAFIRKITDDALAGNSDFGDLEYDDLSQIKSRLETVQAFENSGMSGPLAFLIGLYFFLGIHGQQSHAAWAREIAAKLLADWPVEEWREQFEYLRPAGVLRLDENGLEIITSVLEGRQSV